MKSLLQPLVRKAIWYLDFKPKPKVTRNSKGPACIEEPMVVYTDFD